MKADGLGKSAGTVIPSRETRWLVEIGIYLSLEREGATLSGADNDNGVLCEEQL